MQFINASGIIVHDKIMGTEETAFNWSHADIASCSLFKRIVMFRYQWAGNKQNGTINWFNTGFNSRIHPTQKPVELYKYCLRFAKPGNKILDTHLGSQSSRIAAYKLGFDFWGYEIDADYFKQGCERFEKSIAEPLFTQQNIIQSKLFIK
jgi:site-specific DNA-methyltransferase (adenine-specific)